MNPKRRAVKRNALLRRPFEPSPQRQESSDDIAEITRAVVASVKDHVARSPRNDQTAEMRR